MRKIGQLVQMQATTKTTGAGGVASRVEKRHIDRLWVKMEKIYSAPTWHKKHGAADDGTWLRGLSDFTPADIGRGVARCEKSESEWPPNLPLFRQLCTAVGGEAGTPTTEAAYREASINSHRRGEGCVWSHSAVWLAARKVGLDRLFASTDAREAFEREYLHLVAQVAAGAVLEPAPKPTPPSEWKKGTAEACRSGIATALRLLGRRNG